MSLSERLGAVDRRLIFTLMTLAVAGPILVPLNLPVKVSKEADDFYREIEAVSAGDHVLFALDYEPDVMAELNPMTAAVLDRLFAKGAKVISLTLYPGGVGVAQNQLEEAAKKHGKVYGEDYVFLGYNPDWSGTMLRLGESIRGTYPTDQFGRPTRDLPVLRGCDSYRDIRLLVSISGSAMSEYWAAYAGARYKQRMVSGNTAVQAIFIYPFYQSGQIKGFLGGLKGAAEYETRIGQTGDGVRGMGSQSAGHLLIVLFVALGNAGYLLSRRRPPSAGGAGQGAGG